MFIVLPVGMNYRTERLPVVTLTLMGLNILVYLVSLGFFVGQGEQADLWIIQHLWLIPEQSTWYTYLTSMFVHAGFFHLLGNMLYLFLFGCCVEDLIGRWWFLGLYLLGGFLAQLTHIAGSPDHFASELPMGGASGAISTCMGAYLVLRTQVKIDFRYFALIFFRFFSGEFSLPAWVVMSFWFAKDLFFAALTYSLKEGHGGVAFAAHVGGFLAGLALVGIFKLVAKKQPAPRRAPMRVHLPVTVQAVPVAAASLGTPAFAEPPAETPTIFLHDGAAQYGPYGLSQIQQMLSEGAINNETLYWSEGMTEWRSVSELAPA